MDGRRFSVLSFRATPNGFATKLHRYKLAISIAFRPKYEPTIEHSQEKDSNANP
jgi:hypothetical protein